MHKLLTFFIALLVLAAPKAAHAIDIEIEGPYLGLLGGFNFLDHEKVDAKVGWIGGLHAGYRFCQGVRLEGEISYRYNLANHLKIKGFTELHSNGHLRTWSFMANGYYEIPVCWRLTPYLGAGLGYDCSNVFFSEKHKKRCFKRRIKLDRNHSEDGFAWQLMGGFLYPIDDGLELGLEYRYHRGSVKNLHNNTIDLRMNWFF